MIDSTEEKLDTSKELIEVGRNQINFWLAFLGVLTAVIGLFGFGIPFLMVRNYKQDIDQKVKALDELSELVKKHAEQQIKNMEALEARIDAIDDIQTLSELRKVEMDKLTELVEKKSELLDQTIESVQKLATSIKQQGELNR